jgi:hypothetical protein
MMTENLIYFTKKSTKLLKNSEILTAHNSETGCTEFHFLNILIQRLSTLHNRTKEKLFAISKRPFRKGINKNISKGTPQQQQKEYNNLERELQMETEVKEKAKQTTTNPKKDKQPSGVNHLESLNK